MDKVMLMCDGRMSQYHFGILTGQQHSWYSDGVEQEELTVDQMECDGTDVWGRMRYVYPHIDTGNVTMTLTVNGKPIEHELEGGRVEVNRIGH